MSTTGWSEGARATLRDVNSRHTRHTYHRLRAEVGFARSDPPLFVFLVVQAVVRQCRACLTSHAYSAHCWSCLQRSSFSPHRPPLARRLHAPCRTASSATRRQHAARPFTRNAAPAATARHSEAR